MSKQEKEDPELQRLLDPSNMDGPRVKWTVADLFAIPSSRLGLTYHVMGAGYDYCTPLFGTVGMSLYPVGVRPWHAATLLQQAGNFGLMGGGFGMMAGAALMANVARQGENQERPWNDEGVEDRLRGIQQNFKVRVMDLSVWTGIAVAGGTLMVAGGPKALRLAPGTLGVLQALSIGSSVGSLAGIACISSQKTD